MNQNPPPLSPAPPTPQAQIPAPPSSGSGGKVLAGCGIGCLVIGVLGIVGGILLFNFGKSKLADLATGYVSDEPVAIAEPVVSPIEAQAAVARFDRFRESIRHGQAGEPLALTGDEINALLFNHPDLQALAGRAAVRIEDEQLHATVSLGLDDFDVPFGFLEEALRGKYFNGEASLSIDTEAGRPALYIEDLKVGGRSLPKPILDEMKNENLLKDALSDPDARELLDRIESVRIEGGRLVIVPAAAP